MDFELTDDQRDLQGVVREILDRECPPAVIRAVIGGEDDGSGLWRTLAGLDWPGLAIAEEHGGSGLTAVEVVLLAEELGRVADPTPLLATATQYVPLVQAAGDADQQAALLGAVCGGASGTVAWDGPGNTVTAAADGDGWRLTGTARAVLDGDRTDEVAVVASLPDGGLGVFVVPAVDVVATRTPSFDETLHVADLTFDGLTVAADRVSTSADAGDAVAEARILALAGLAAAMVGASQRTFDLGLGHLRDRKQFGVPIGSFQAMKHMAVDVYIAIERARALCHFAGLAVAEGDERRTVAGSMAKAAAGDCQRIASQHGIQFFGGLGYTWENDLHLYVRRAKAGELLLGTAAHHRAVVARSIVAGVAS